MARLRRRILLGAALTLVIVVASAALRVGYQMNRALSDVDAMIVPTVVLPPTATSATVRAPSRSLPGVSTPVPIATAVPTPEPAPNEPINILLLGTDARPGEAITRTDAMVLVHINRQAKRVSLLSIPRDLWVDIPGFGPQRVNAAYPIGERQIGPGYGGALAKETVSALVGIPVHHFILVDFQGFKAVIDTIGGISIDVPKAIDDPKYPTEDLRTVAIHFDAGIQQMDGERALIYARTRHADSDFGRNRRQQQVLMAVFDRVRDRGLLDQLGMFDQYTAALRDYIRTDLARSDMLGLAKVASGFRTENVQLFSIGPNMITNLEQPATFAADPVALRKVVEEMTGAGSAPETTP